MQSKKLIISFLSLFVALLSRDALSQSCALILRDKAVDIESFNQTTNFLAGNFWLPIRSDSKASDCVSSGSSEQEALAKRLTRSNDIVTVMLIGESWASGRQTILVSTNPPLALVNLRAIKQRAAILGDTAAQEYPHLLQKEVMRAIGAVFGLQDCLNPCCCMCDTELVPGMRIIGVNFCPPCLTTFEKMIPPPKTPRSK